MDVRVKCLLALSQIALMVSTSLAHLTSVPGDVYLAGAFTISTRPNGAEDCNGEVSVVSVMELEIVKWTIRRLNQQNYIPGVKIGLLAYPTCMSEELAGYRAVEISTAIKEKSQNIIGVIGAERSSDSESMSAIFSRLPGSLCPPMVSYSSTSVSLSNKQAFPNFFRTIYSDELQVKVLTSLMSELEWNYIAIVYENNSYGLHGAHSLQTELHKRGICIRYSSSFNTTYGVELSTLSQIIKDITLPKGGAVSGIVFFGGQSSAEKFLTAMTDLDLGGDTPSIMFSEGAGTSKNVFKQETLSASRGNLVVSPTYRSVDIFLEHWNNIFRNRTVLADESKTNPWLKDVFTKIKGCSYDNPNCQVPTGQEIENAVSKNIYLKFAVDAVCMFAKALKQSKNQICLNDSCSLLTEDGINNFLNALKSVEVNMTSEFGDIFAAKTRLQFDYNGDIKPSESKAMFSVYNHRQCLDDISQFCFIEVATFADNTITMNRTLLKDYDQYGSERSYHKAQCKRGDICTHCLRDDEQIFYKPGDLLIVAAFPIHNIGTKPLQCGGLRNTVGLDVAMTIEYAVETVNNSTMFDGTSVGFLLLDTCNDPLVIQEKILRLYKRGGYPRLPPDVTERILGFVGSVGSTPTSAMLSVTKELQGKPQVGCCSTFSDLSNRQFYPNFVRVSTPLDQTAETMVQIAKQLNAFYIQIIYSSGFYGEGGKDSILTNAKKLGICVANEIEVPEKSNYITVLDTLRTKPSAKVVLTFLRSHVGPYVMEVLADNMESGGEFYFIGSETLGTREQYLIPRLKGTISVAQNMPQSPSYVQFLKTKKPSPLDDNTWLLEVIQSRQGCFYPWSFNKSSTLSRECGSADSLSNDENLVDLWAPYSLNAAFALLKGSASALRDICKTTKMLCSGYSDTEKVLQHIKEVKLDLNQNGSLFPVFDENGDGKYGHRIYFIDSNDGKLFYKLIGYRTQLVGFVFNMEDNIFPGYPGHTKCPNQHDCKYCEKFLIQPAPSSGEHKSSTEVPLIVGIAISSGLALLFFVLFFCQCRKSRTANNDHYNTAHETTGYLDVQHFERPVVHPHACNGEIN